MIAVGGFCPGGKGVSRVFAGSLVLGWVSCSLFFLYKTDPDPRKKYLLWEKRGLNATFWPNFSWVGLALGWRVRRFHHDIYICFPTQQKCGKSQTPYYRGT